MSQGRGGRRSSAAVFLLKVEGQLKLVKSV